MTRFRFVSILFSKLLLAAIVVVEMGSTVASINNSLDGYSFACGGQANFVPAGPLYGFVGSEEVHCFAPDGMGGGSTYKCGSYAFSGSSSPASLVINGDGIWEGAEVTASNLWFGQGGVLVSFQTDLSAVPCIVTGLDWQVIEDNPVSVRFDCPNQNAIPGISYEVNQFILSNTGYVWFTSILEPVGTVARSEQTIRRDYHGVFLWERETNRIVMYSGEQAGEDKMALNGTLDPTTGELYIDGFSQATNKPCLATTATSGFLSSLPFLESYPIPVLLGQNAGNDETKSTDNANPSSIDGDSSNTARDGMDSSVSAYGRATGANERNSDDNTIITVGIGDGDRDGDRFNAVTHGMYSFSSGSSPLRQDNRLKTILLASVALPLLSL